jgi:hypothetical protein
MAGGRPFRPPLLWPVGGRKLAHLPPVPYVTQIPYAMGHPLAAQRGLPFSPMTDPGPASLVALRFSQAIEADPGRACEVFTEDEAAWLGTPVESAAPGVRRYLTDLSLPVRAGAPHLQFKKAAFVDVGPVTCGDDRCEVPISWRSSTLAPLFPVFSGLLTITPSEIRLEGFYAPPGGDVGLVLDKAFLNIAARGTARWFLARVIAIIDALAIEPWEEAEGPAPGQPRHERSGAA